MNEPSCDVKEIQKLATLNGDAIYQIKTKDGKTHEVLYKYLSIDGCTKYMCGNPWTGKIYSIKQSDVKRIYYSTEEKEKEKMKTIGYSNANFDEATKLYDQLDLHTMIDALYKWLAINSYGDEIVLNHANFITDTTIQINAKQMILLLEHKIKDKLEGLEKSKNHTIVIDDWASLPFFIKPDAEKVKKLPINSDIAKILINEKKRVVTVTFTNGDVKMAKCSEKDEFDPEVGVSLCMAYHEFGSKTKYKKYLKSQAKWIKKETKDE